MSWQLGAFGVLFVALAAGFGWYERTRPDARMVALVATLAAFAALGRIAFAALPNVKPTTDIVLISGYALGPAPGFVVGALAGLTSNFFFGQGPWTPWQMAAWGMTGVIGAGLGVATRRRLGRWPLAVICAGVGFAFTAAQDFGDWVTYSDHSLGQLSVYVGKGLGFDAIHAAGCFGFALAFGPALARSLTRYADRLRTVWRPSGSVTAAVLLAALLFGGCLAGQPGAGGGGVLGGGGPAIAEAAGTPVSYLLAAQNPDGGFGGAPGQASTALFSGWAALGLAAEGRDPAGVSRAGHSLLDYLRASAGGASDPGSLERTILAAAAAGARPQSFGGRNLVTSLEREIGADGAVSDQTNLTSFAVLALRAAGIHPAARTLSWLIRQEDQDGGFNVATAGAVSDVDDTGAALEAMVGAPGAVATRARTRAVAFIRREQDPNGGFPSSAGAGSNAQSTAWAVQGLIAAGAAGATLNRAIGYLDLLIAPDGHIRYSRSSDQTPVWVTGEAMMALARAPLPLKPAPAILRRAPRPLPLPTSRVPARAKRSSRQRQLRRVRRAAAAPVPDATTLATDAGIIDALVLAPVGVG